MNLDLPVDLSGLVALQERLRSFLSEYEEKVAQARTQLHHVEALLSHFPADANTTSARKRGRAEVKVETEAPKKRVRRSREGSLTLLPAYQGKTLTEAVQAVLEANRGKCLDADTIIKTIYGDLTGEALALAKDRITKNLSKGKIDGLWERVPEMTGYYTISVADLPSDLASLNLPKKVRGGRKKLQAEAVTNGARSVSKRKEVKVKRSRNSLGGLKMRAPYQGSTMMSAIAKILQERKGEFVNADMVVKTLYGDLPSETYRIVKDRVTKSLSKGKIDGLWERVPDQAGYYTLSMSAVLA